jgi:cob(I)alamin adenosyltransferase
MDTWPKSELRKEYSGNIRQAERNTVRAGICAKASQEVAQYLYQISEALVL